VYAECTFIGISLGIYKTRVVRAGGNTSLASAAFIVMNEHNAPHIVNVTCAAGAAIHTGRVIAMIASFRPNLHMYIGHLANRFISQPVSVKSFGHLIFSFARNNTIHAAYTLFSINNHSKTRHAKPPQKLQS
jgi:hypothetical protein